MEDLIYFEFVQVCGQFGIDVPNMCVGKCCARSVGGRSDVWNNYKFLSNR